ncbi:cohesin domain-containing protein [Patescibacteria group bacterium]
MKKICLLLLFFLSLFWLKTTVYAASPHLELVPSTGTISTAGTDIEVNIDTGGMEAKSAKVVLNYDSAKLEVDSITAGAFFDEVSHNIYNSTGEVVINANLSLGSSLESKTGTGTLATMTVKAKASTGTANLTFDCTDGSSTDSGINDPTPLDIIDCTANLNGSYTLGTSTGSPAPSVSPSASPAVGGPQPSASVLPVAGTTGPTLNILLLGLGFIILSVPLFLFI